MDLGIAQTAKLTADYAAVLFWKITRQFSVTIVRCGFTMDALSSQNLSMKLWKIQTVSGFAQNVTFSTFPILFLMSSYLESQNRFDPLTKEKKTGSSSSGIGKNNSIGGLKFVSTNINRFRAKNVNCWPSLIFTSLILWLFRKQKLTAPLQLQNCSRNLAHTMYTGKTETFMAAV